MKIIYENDNGYRGETDGKGTFVIYEGKTEKYRTYNKLTENPVTIFNFLVSEVTDAPNHLLRIYKTCGNCVHYYKGHCTVYKDESGSLKDVRAWEGGCQEWK